MFVIEKNRIYIHPINMIYFFTVLVWFLFQVMDSSISSTSADLPEVVDLDTLPILLSIGRESFGCMDGTTISATLLHRHFGMC